MIKKSFKLKLILSYAAVILVSFGAIALFLDRNLEHKFLDDLKSSLVTQAGLIESRLQLEKIGSNDNSSLQELLKDLSLKAKCRLTLINRNGVVLADSEKSREEIPLMENHLSRPEIASALAGHVGEDRHYSSTLKIHMVYVAVPHLSNPRF